MEIWRLYTSGQAVRVYRGVEEKKHTYNPWHSMEVPGQLQNPSTLHSGKNAHYTLDRRVVAKTHEPLISHL
jgi:hypothetical protein